MKLVSIVLFALLLPIPGAAQSGVYIQAGPLLDSRFTPTFDGGSISGGLTGGTSTTYEWIDLNGDRRWQPGEEGAVVPSTVPARLPGEESRQRFAPGASAAIGVFVSPSVSVRLEGSFQGDQVTTTDMGGLLTSLSTREVASVTDIAVAAGWHQGESRRMSIIYLAGMVFRRTTYDTTLSYVFPPFVGRTFVSPVTAEESFESITYGQGVMAGIDVAVRLSDRFAVVPQIRMVAASQQWNLRPAIAMRWRP